ncbi:MAG: hypothetical protein A2Y56_15910 [Candidatus Aminicenantes bacterium RBG_13_63_10]|nr:MAG: hypothetical protein A2Y56_15910 [Candidatus Aminicenantes bacterium RBG_13_63_10]
MLLLLAAFLPTPAAPSSNEDFSLGASLDWNSRYIWRGITAGETAVLQPSIWTSLFGYNLEAWANYPLRGSDGRRGFDEFNLFLEGTSPRQALAVVPGLNIYTYPHAEENESWTAEIALTFYMPVGPVWLFWENDVDVVSHRAAYYAEFGLQAGRDVAESLNLEVALAQGYATAGFNAAYLGIAQCGLTYLTAHIGIGWRLAGILTLTPHLEAVFTVGRELRKELGTGVRFNLGMALTLGRD